MNTPKSFKTFFKKGIIARKQAQCPYCGSLERTRVLDFFLEKKLKLYDTKIKISVLHIAPEDPIKDKLKKLDNINYIDGDILSAYANHVVDITDIQYPDNYFDFIICSHVLGHVANEDKAIIELFRVLKSGGNAIIMTLFNGSQQETIEYEFTNTEKERVQWYGEPDLDRLHGLDLLDKFRNKFFSVQLIDFRLEFPLEIREKNSLGDGQREKIILCKKL